MPLQRHPFGEQISDCRILTEKTIVHFAGTFQIPTYAIPMLEYGDTTGLTDLDIELVNGFIASNFPHGYVVDWTGIDQPYFASHPEFGIAAEVVEANFYHA